MEVALRDSKFPVQIRGFAKHISTKQQLTNHTVRNYVNDLVPLIHYLREQKTKDLDELDRLFLRRYLASLISSGFDRSSVARKLSALRSFFKFLYQSGEILMDPSDLVSGPNREKKLPTVTSIFEIEKLLEAPDVGTDLGIRDRSILEVIYAAGLRVSEAVSIDIDKFDLEKKELQVIGKGSKPRIVLIGAHSVRWLRRYLIDVRPKLTVRQSNTALWINQSGGRYLPVQYSASSRNTQHYLSLTLIFTLTHCVTVLQPICSMAGLI